MRSGGRNRKVATTAMAPNCRLETLKKKASELSTLCGVDVCFVCFTPDGGVLTWPEKLPEVRSIVSRYRQQVQSKLCSPAKKRKVSRSLSRNAQSDDDTLGLLSAKLAILNEKIQGLERKNLNPGVRVCDGEIWRDNEASLNPGVKVCDGEIWRELEGVELGELGSAGEEEGECFLSVVEIESWVSPRAAEGEMATQSSHLPSALLTLNEQSGASLCEQGFILNEKHKADSESLSFEQWMNSDSQLGMELGDRLENPGVRVCDSEIWRELEGVELGELGSVGEEGECFLSQEEIESWVSTLAAEGEMATQSSHLPSALTLNEQSGGDFEIKNKSPLYEQGLIFNKDDSESFSCEQWMEMLNSDSELDLELGDAQFWGIDWEFGEAETHMDMDKRTLSWDWNLLPIPIPTPIE